MKTMKFENQLPKVESIEDMPEHTIMAYINKHGYIVDAVARKLLSDKSKRTSYWLKKLESQGLVVSKKQLVKLETDSQFRVMSVYRLPENESKKRKK